MRKSFRSEQEFIVNESPEVSVGESIGWMNRLAASFPAFQNQDYKRYFAGQLISLIGTWMQIVAQGWLVLKLTNSAFLIGLIAALGALPSLLFTLVGGVIVDRYSKKKILLITQISAMVLAFVLGILTISEQVKVWEIGLIAFLLGTVNAIDAPARQSFVSEMVSKEQLPSAIALNSSVFNAARVVGPSMAGLLIALVGTGSAFMVNGVSYIAVIIALWFIQSDVQPERKNMDTWEAIKEGLSYSYAHPIIRVLILFTAVTSIFGWSYTTLLPIMAQDIFHVGASGLGYLYGSVGLGSLLATLFISVFSKKIAPIVFIIGGNALFALSMIAFSYTTSLHMALLLLFFSGLGLLSQFAMMNTTIQSLVKSEFRGRVMSIYILMFIGLTPLGNFEIGWLAEHMGTGFAIRTGAIIVLVFGQILFVYRKRIIKGYNEYKAKNGIA
jgi:MFS family permease